MIHILCAVRSRHEFNTAAAINAAGAFAAIPRRVDITPAKYGKPERIEYRPLLPGMMFLACTESEWHAFHSKRLQGPNGILPPIRKELDILPRTWSSCQDFAARAEQECEYRREMHERGRKVANMRPGDMLRIIGTDMLDGQLRDHLPKFARMERGQMLIETNLTIMGRPVIARVRPDDVQGVMK